MTPKKTPLRPPTQAAIRAARARLHLTQAAAAAVIHCSMRTWQGYEDGTRQMHPAFWELFTIKTRGE